MFKKWTPQLNLRYNSDCSSKFLDAYENGIIQELKKERLRPHRKSFAPSQFRCPRISWFRLRGVSPDMPPDPDIGLNFTAEVGTALHLIIQNHLINNESIEWVDVKSYIESKEYPYSFNIKSNGIEWMIEIENPPVTFACDGIVRWGDTYYLLEIKSCEHTTWEKLTGPKDEHVDQIHLYSSLLDIQNVMMMYIDRQYGGMKCFDLKIPSYVKDSIFRSIDDILDKVESHIAPDGLPSGDKWCQPSYCSYYKKCKEYGRW